jgi:hypothetical protein
MRLKLDKATAFYVAARSRKGWSVKRLIVELEQRERKSKTEAELWDRNPPERIAKQMTDKKTPIIATHIETHQIEEALRRIRPPGMKPLSGGLPPLIIMSVDHDVIFQDESAKTSWNVTGADVSYTDLEGTSRFLIPDNSGNACAVKYGGLEIGGGSSPPIQGDFTGSHIINSSFFPTTQHWVRSVRSTNSVGYVRDYRFIDRLDVPKFTGDVATSSRINMVRDALRQCFKLLRSGRIYNDTFLDNVIPAFKNKHLDRISFYYLLYDLITNISIVTFHCQDLPDSEFGKTYSWANAKNWSNTIWLSWFFPSKGGPGAKGIFHELVHKCGFNYNMQLGMGGGYNMPQVEDMVYYIVDVFFGETPDPLDPSLWP